MKGHGMNCRPIRRDSGPPSFRRILACCQFLRERREVDLDGLIWTPIYNILYISSYKDS